MSLYLVQHGKSNPKDINPLQRLSEQGILDAERIAGVAAGYRVQVGSIIHSNKTRARQTASVMAEHLAPGLSPGEAPGLGPNDDVEAFAQGLSPDNDLMVVGHLPFLSRLVSFLITGSTDSEIFRFQNGGIVCMDRQAEKDSWFIRWTLMPEIR
ncbi:MAG TPA: phosphohistidine phosphatase SixA [Deltaproteobacteria bacterium]|nr:phosphohistidine phosphatase SixA [Deltaproteobacteria bacterium]